MVQLDLKYIYIYIYTWSLTLQEERRLRVFENKVLRRIFGPRKGRGNGGMEEIA